MESQHPVIKIDCVCSMSMVGYVAMSSVVRMVAAAQTIPHAVMSSCCTDGIITEYNTISHAVGWLVPVSRTDGNITDYNTVMYAVGWWFHVDGLLCGHVFSCADGSSCANHPPCGWLCWLVPVSRADGITIPSCMRLAGNHDRLSFLIPVIKIDCVCSMSMGGYVVMSCGWNHNTISRADDISCANHPPCGYVFRLNGWNHNTIMYAVGW